MRDNELPSAASEATQPQTTVARQTIDYPASPRPSLYWSTGWCIPQRHFSAQTRWEASSNDCITNCRTAFRPRLAENGEGPRLRARE
jgi:hypothetical protein